MLHIILLILKIIGIVLLCIIGAVVLALVCVLFVPVRYRIEAARKEGEGQPPAVVRVKVTWLLHLLNILIRYPNETLVRARLMIFTIFRMPDKKTPKDKKRKKKKEKESLEKDSKGKSSDAAEQTVAEKIPAVTIKAMKPEEDEAGTEEAYSFTDKLRALPAIIRKSFWKIKSLLENIQYTIQRFCDKIKSISDNIQYYKEVVESDLFKKSFGLCKEELIKCLKSLKPQTFQARLTVGMDDPAATAEILAVWGMLYPVWGGQVDVAGDFETKRIEGRVFIKGRIRLCTILWVAVRIYFNKDIKRLLKLLKKEAA